MAKKEDNSKNSEVKGKQAKIKKSNAKKAAEAAVFPDTAEAPKAKGEIRNYGCCCTCSHYPSKINGVTQPCKTTGNYVARKNKVCPANAYKCKFS